MNEIGNIKWIQNWIYQDNCRIIFYVGVFMVWMDIQPISFFVTRVFFLKGEMGGGQRTSHISLNEIYIQIRKFILHKNVKGQRKIGLVKSTNL